MSVYHVAASNPFAAYRLPDVEAEDESEALAAARQEARRNSYGGDPLVGLLVRAYPCTPTRCGNYHEHRSRRARP